MTRRRGLGETVLFASSLNAQWSDLPAQAAFVPLMRGLVGHLGSFAVPARNLQVGDRITAVHSVAASGEGRAEGPGGVELVLRPGIWEGRQARVSEPVLTPGVYTVRDSPRGPITRYAVTLAAEESGLRPQPSSVWAEFFGNTPVNAFHRAEDVARSLDPAHRRAVELWRGLLLAAVAMLFSKRGSRDASNRSIPHR